MTPGHPIMCKTLLRAARACARARREPLRVISRAAYGDSGFFRRVAQGKPFTGPKFDEVMAWLGDPKNWPDEIVPPEVVDLFAGMGTTT